METWSQLPRSPEDVHQTPNAGSSTLESSADETGSGAIHGTATATEAEPTELVIVEGKSAADAFDQVRNRKRQSLYVLQGKIPNPARQSRERLEQHTQLGPLLLGPCSNFWQLTPNHQPAITSSCYRMQI